MSVWDRMMYWMYLALSMMAVGFACYTFRDREMWLWLAAALVFVNESIDYSNRRALRD